MPREDGLGYDAAGDFLQRLFPQLLAHLSERLALPIVESHTILNVLARDMVLRYQVRVAQQ